MKTRQYNPEMSRRGFLSRALAATAGATGAAYLTGCATVPKSDLPAVVQAQYDAIDLDNLTPEQQHALDEVKKAAKSGNYSLKHIKEVKRRFPWVNLLNMSDEDRIVIYQNMNGPHQAM